MQDLNYTLEPKHFQDFSTAAARAFADVNTLKGQLLWGIGVGVIVGAGAIVVAILSDSTLAGWSFGLGAWFFWFINYATGIYVMRRADAAAFHTSGLVLGPRHLLLDDSGLHVTGPFGRQFVNWRAVKNTSVQSTVIVLWTDNAAGIFVPRSAFTSSDAEKSFIELVSAKIDAL